MGVERRSAGSFVTVFVSQTANPLGFGMRSRETSEVAGQPFEISKWEVQMHGRKVKATGRAGRDEVSIGLEPDTCRTICISLERCRPGVYFLAPSCGVRWRYPSRHGEGPLLGVLPR